MLRPGRRLFSVAAILLIVVAGLHTIGHFSPPPDDAAPRAVEAALYGYYRISPPLVTLALVWVLFLVALPLPVRPGAPPKVR